MTHCWSHLLCAFGPYFNWKCASWKVIPFGETEATIKKSSDHSTDVWSDWGDRHTSLWGSSYKLENLISSDHCCQPTASTQLSVWTLPASLDIVLLLHRGGGRIWAVDGWGRDSLLDTAQGGVRPSGWGVWEEEHRNTASNKTALKGLLGGTQMEPRCVWKPETGSGDIGRGESANSTGLLAFFAA